MTRGGAEIPNPGVAVSGEQAVPDQLVASPLADDGARDIANVVLIETQHRAQAGFLQGLARPREAITMQPAELHTLFEIDLRRARRLERPVPAMRRLEIVLVDGKEFRFVVQLFRHGTPPSMASRGAATECSPGHEPGVFLRTDIRHVGAKESSGICALT